VWYYEATASYFNVGGACICTRWVGMEMLSKPLGLPETPNVPLRLPGVPCLPPPLARGTPPHHFALPLSCGLSSAVSTTFSCAVTCTCALPHTHKHTHTVPNHELPCHIVGRSAAGRLSTFSRRRHNFPQKQSNKHKCVLGGAADALWRRVPLPLLLSGCRALADRLSSAPSIEPFPTARDIDFHNANAVQHDE
jgi:hypothetical protein